MKKLLAGLAVSAAALITLPNAASAQSSETSIMLLHGIPGATVDVVVNGEVVIPGFEPGDMQDLTAFAGQTLQNVEVRAAGTDTVVIGPIASLPVPASGNATVVAHLNADGTPVLTPFANDTSATAAGQGRLVVRHTAAAPAVDIVVGDARPITNLSNPNEAKLDLAAGPIAGAKVAPTGGDPIADLPTIDVKAGESLTVYAVGSLEDNTFTVYTQSITGLGGAPAGVPTGNSLPSDGSFAWQIPAALALGVVAFGAFALRRRGHTA